MRRYNAADDPSPLHVTLFQEVEGYNILLNNILSTLTLLKMGIKAGSYTRPLLSST